MAKAEFDQGLADNAKVLQGMSINFKRTDAQEAACRRCCRRSRIRLHPAITNG